MCLLMSKETSSTLLRYGINSFWSNSISSSRSLYLPMQLNSYFYLFFKNYFLMPLKIQYNKNKVIIYIFYYKNEKLTFLQKYFIWKKTKLHKLILRKNYNHSSLQTDSKKNRKKLINYKILLLLTKYILVKLFYCKLKQNKEYNDYIFKKYLKIKRTFKNTRKKKIKLKKINFILKIKKLSLINEIIINSYTNNCYKIIIKPALKKLFYNKMPFFFKYIKNSIQKNNIYILLIAFIFNKSNIINLFVANIIKNTKNKKHIKNLIFFINIVKLLFEKQFISFTGYKFFIAGRLNGKLRKSSFGFKMGSLKLLSYSTNVFYSCDVVHTQYGCFSLKSWLCLKSND